MRRLQDLRGVHPAVIKKMRQYAIKQALDELGENANPERIEQVAKAHILSYAELKEAFYAKHPREN